MAYPLPVKPSIAVLPFDNLGSDPAQEILSDGLTNDIITDLSRFNVFVIASNSTFTYKDKAVKAQQVAEDLGVRYVLEGSLQKAGERLRINAQLIDATTGHHLWAERYDRSASEFFTIQEDILRTIVATLAAEVTKAEFDRALGKKTSELKAYDYFLQAQKSFRGYTREANQQALELIEKALELDPDYARAYSLSTWIHANNSSARYSWGEDPDRSLELVLEAAQKAVELDPDDYGNHWALGFAQMFHGDFDRAEAGYARAISLNPHDATLLASMVELLWKIGKAEQAIAQMKLAMRLNPHHPDWYFWDLALAQYFAGNYEKALITLNRMSNPPNGSRRARAAVLVRPG
jgi:adenylate cyclase